MTETTIGREPVQVVEILQPLCTNIFGTAPCTATGAGPVKCYNTRATCKDTANFALGTPLSLFFASGKVAERGITGAAYIIPSLVSVSTSPTRINLSGANPDANGLGNRALCTITFSDHPHTDRIVDPYLSGRDWDPMTRGSFWTRWLVRNKYRQNVQIRVYEGYAGQALSAMTKRTYFLQSLDGPDDSGRVVIQGKDILARIEERKAQAPVQSPGVLYAGINASATSLTIANAVLADYPSSGTLRINDELMTYTSTATGANGVNVSGITRATDGTTARNHSSDDAVQECLRYTAAALDTVLEDLLTTYGGIDAAYLNTAAWATEVSNNLLAYTLNGVVSVPTSVTELVSEIQQQVPSNIWWDERTALVELKAIRGVDSLPDLVTAENNIIAGSFSLSEKPRERASQVWIYYTLRNKAENERDPKNYQNATIVANLESETDELYGEPSVRKIFARWLNTSALAETTASKISTVYVDIPTQCRFHMDAKDRDYWIGDTVRISHHLDVDEFGERRVRRWTIVSAEEVIPGETVEYLAEDTTLYGQINYIMAPGAADYVAGGPNPAKNCFIGDATGLLSDATACGTIS